MTTFSSNLRIATALTVAVLSATSAFPAAPVQAADTEVKIDQHAFIPQRITVKAGAPVAWVNDDDIPHTVA
jgi:plastocyanin